MTYNVVEKAADFSSPLAIANVDDVIASVNAIAIVVVCHPAGLAFNVARFEVVKEAFSCKQMNSTHVEPIKLNEFHRNVAN